MTYRSAGSHLAAKCIALALITFAAMSSAASAAVIFSNDRAGFEAGLNSLITDDYENPAYVFIQSDATMSAVFGETTYNTTGFSDLNIVFSVVGGHGYCAGCNGSFLLDFTSASIGSPSGIDGVGFDFFNVGSQVYNAFVTFGDDSTSNFVLPATAASGAFSDFWGITSPIDIKSIHFGLANGGATTSGNFGIDNLTIGAVSVSEPATLAILALGLAGLGFARLRKHARC